MAQNMMTQTPKTLAYKNLTQYRPNAKGAEQTALDLGQKPSF